MDTTTKTTTDTTTTPETAPKRRRGFAAMDPEKVRALASKGGQAVHAQGKAHRFTQEKAREAGRKGGLAPHVSRGRAKTAA